MKQYNVRTAIFKGIGNGLFCSLFINVLAIISLYVDFPLYICYLIGVPPAIMTYVFLRQKRMVFFFIALIISILSFIATEIFVSMTNLVHLWYLYVYPDIGEMSAGSGLAIMLIYFYNLIWIALGTIGAFVQTILWIKR